MAEERYDAYAFQMWPKIPRLNRNMIITEKIDGTNAQIVVADREEIEYGECADLNSKYPWIFVDDYALLAGSRKRYLTKEKDNYGFARWVEDNAGSLVYLGLGTHYGEWWGGKCQRGYGLKEKRFSLFNVSRYGKPDYGLPEIVSVVPTLYEGLFSCEIIELVMHDLRTNGSKAVPGWMKPEGIVVYHSAANQTFKVLCEGDDKPKGVR